MSKPTPNVPAFIANGTPIYHSYKGDSPLSYWYRLTPDTNGIDGEDEDATGAFDVRDLSAAYGEPQFDMRADGDVNEQYEQYRAAHMQWAKDACESDFASIRKNII